MRSLSRVVLVALLLAPGAAWAWDGVWVMGAADRHWKKTQFTSISPAGKRLSHFSLSDKVFKGRKSRSNSASVDASGRMWVVVEVDSPDLFKRTHDYYAVRFGTTGNVLNSVKLLSNYAGITGFSVAADTHEHSVWILEEKAGDLWRLDQNGKIAVKRRDSKLRGGFYVTAIPTAPGGVWVGGWSKGALQLDHQGIIRRTFHRPALHQASLHAARDGSVWFHGAQNLGNYRVYHHLVRVARDGKVLVQRKSFKNNQQGKVLAARPQGGAWVGIKDKYGKPRLARLSANGAIEGIAPDFVSGSSLRALPNGHVWFAGKLTKRPWGIYLLDPTGKLRLAAKDVGIRYIKGVLR
jgi:hypothetical protein